MRSLIRTGSFDSQPISARGRPKTALGWNICPRRIEIVDSSRALAMSTARSQPELPAPTVSTRVPADVGDRAIRARMDLPTRELARVRRHVRLPQVPVADEHAGVGALVAVGGRDAPAVPPGRADRRDPLDPHAEAHVRPDPGLAREALEVVAHLVAAGIDGIVRRHRIAREPRQIRDVIRCSDSYPCANARPRGRSARSSRRRSRGAEHLHRAETGGAGPMTQNRHQP